MKLLALALAALSTAAAADPPNGKIVGNQSAPIRLEVFSDFSCPGCKKFHEETLPIVLKEFVTPGKACIVFRDYVLPPTLGHLFSGDAARVACASNRIGKYREVSDALFLNQSSWAMSGRIWDYVGSVLTPAEQSKVKELSKDPSIFGEVKNDTDTGNRAGLARTPTVGVIFGNQRQMWDKWTPDHAFFLDYLRSLLKK
jgi:protein-disulfide isomerase